MAVLETLLAHRVDLRSVEIAAERSEVVLGRADVEPVLVGADQRLVTEARAIRVRPVCRVDPVDEVAAERLAGGADRDVDEGRRLERTGDGVLGDDQDRMEPTLRVGIEVALGVGDERSVGPRGSIDGRRQAVELRDRDGVRELLAGRIVEDERVVHGLNDLRTERRVVRTHVADAQALVRRLQAELVPSACKALIRVRESFPAELVLVDHGCRVPWGGGAGPIGNGRALPFEVDPRPGFTLEVAGQPPSGRGLCRELPHVGGAHPLEPGLGHLGLSDATGGQMRRRDERRERHQDQGRPHGYGDQMS